MGDLTIGDIFGLADKITSLGLLLLFGVGFARGWWVPGWVYKARDKEVDGWRDIALTAVPTLKEVVSKK